MIFHQNSNRYSSTKNRHAEGKCIKEHAEVDDFFVEIRPEIEPRKNRHAQGCSLNNTSKLIFCAKMQSQKMDTPKVIASFSFSYAKLSAAST